MSRYTGPSWKQSRRLGFSLTGTGKELARRNYVPGQHGPNNRSKLSGCHRIWCMNCCTRSSRCRYPTCWIHLIDALCHSNRCTCQ